MPSRQDILESVDAELEYEPDINSSTTEDFISRDVENLVSEIRENLRLSGLKMRQQKRPRPSPYSNASRSANLNDLYCQKTPCENCSKNGTVCPHRNCNSVTDDPYEMLQDLLRDGGLIKEAVRRLQRGFSPKDKYFYDSDDETNRSPYRFYHNLEI